MPRWFAPLWGIFGIAGLLVQAMVRMVPRVHDMLQQDLAAWQWGLLVLWVGWMAHAEGLRGFHRRFSPRIVARAVTLTRSSSGLHRLLAPIYCMGYIHASRRRKIVAWAVSSGIALLAAGVGRLPPLWRGFVDAGVVVGLGIGLASLGYYTVQALTGKRLPVDPELPS